MAADSAAAPSTEEACESLDARARQDRVGGPAAAEGAGIALPEWSAAEADGTHPEVASRPATPPGSDLIARMKFALRAADQAGAILLGHVGRLRGYDEKSPIDLVTAADRESEAAILAELAATFPRDAVIAEERDGGRGATAWRGTAAAPWTWAIDPLDGTTNFAHGYPAWAVSIGLLYCGAPVLGVVAVPPRRELYCGGAGLPATRNGAPIAVSTVDRLSRALVATGFPYDRRARMPELLGWLGAILAEAHCVRRSGSAATDLCDLACGRIDAFYEVGLKPWDLAAGCAIVAAAGGRVTALDGGGHDLFGGKTAGSNGAVHAALVARLATTGLYAAADRSFAVESAPAADSGRPSGAGG